MSPDDPARVFAAHRPRLVRLAYRMLGSTAEAEDVVQDAWLRWQRADHASVRDAAPFLARTVTRLCLDVMKSARAQREIYVGSWLPEPIIETGEEPEADELTLALMLALERLSPLERAAFLLHDLFAVPLDEIARTLDRDASAVRQLAVRARRHVQEARPRFPVPPEQGEKIALAFFRASISGDIAALRTILAEDIVMRADGGGKVPAFLNPIQGRDRVLRLIAGLHRKRGAHASVLIRPTRIDGLPGYVSRDGHGILQTTAFAIEHGRIRAIFITRNPDKLVHVEASLAALH